MAKKVTIRQVAERAGISVTTVSQILNGKGERFSEITRKKVKAAQAELGYEPNYYARAMVGARTSSFGVVIPDIMNPFFASLAVSVEHASLPLGYFPQVFSINGSAANVDYFIQQFAGGTQQGLIMAAPGVSQEIFERLGGQLPMVLTDQADVDAAVDRVMIDNQGGGANIAGKLLQQGHTRIAIVIPETLPENLTSRVAGYRQAFMDAEVKFPEDLVFHVPFSPSGGQQAVSKIVATDATAIIAINDDVANGVYRGLFLLGKRIPQDYSVVGFDDISQAAFMTPALTTVAQPMSALGAQLVDLLMARLAAPTRRAQIERLPVRLVERESTKSL